jgi:hypothetical protein
MTALKKKLIQLAFPAEEVKKAAAREKSGVRGRGSSMRSTSVPEKSIEAGVARNKR